MEFVNFGIQILNTKIHLLKIITAQIEIIFVTPNPMLVYAVIQSIEAP